MDVTHIDTSTSIYFFSLLREEENTRCRSNIETLLEDLETSDKCSIVHMQLPRCLIVGRRKEYEPQSPRST